MKTIKALIVHASASPDGRDDRAEDIHRWHHERGWDGIGYHYVIDRDGTIEFGRPWYWMGAHVRGNNANTLGICLIGTEEFTEAQHDSLQAIIQRERDNHPDAIVRGHNDYDKRKADPNFNVSEWATARGIDPK